MLNELEQKIRKAIPELNILIKGGEKKFKRGKIVELIEKQIQFNHILEYVLKLQIHRDKYLIIIYLWNLKSNLLSDQSEELIKYLNDL